MGLFGKSKDGRKDIKRQVDKMMKQYDKGKINGATYLQKMMDFTSSVQKNKKK